jgi:F-box interacting protein
MEKNDNSSWDLLTDALVEVLVRVPPNARRRLRLVSRHWRELIDHRTGTDMRSRSKIIAVSDKGLGLMSVIDIQTPGSPRRLLWQTDIATALRYSMMRIAGTCNGLVCLCDDLSPGGAITVANPSTGEALPLPPLPTPSADVHLSSNSSWNWHHTYSFGYDHRTRRYKVVHVPCTFDDRPDIVHVFTLGEASWRAVHTGGTDARCSPGTSCLAEVDGTVYWLTMDAGKIMSFDLIHERVMCTEPLPVPAMASTYHLAKVHGSLGVAVGDNDSVTVWVLEGERWRRRYVLEVDRLRREKTWMTRELLVPYQVHGDYFLTFTPQSWNGTVVLYRHTLTENTGSQDGVVQVKHRDRGEELTYFSCFIYQTFSYVETKEPLSLYNDVLVHN